jgi:hypothetical protein
MQMECDCYLKFWWTRNVIKPHSLLEVCVCVGYEGPRVFFIPADSHLWLLCSSIPPHLLFDCSAPASISRRLLLRLWSRRRGCSLAASDFRSCHRTSPPAIDRCCVLPPAFDFGAVHYLRLPIVPSPTNWYFLNRDARPSTPNRAAVRVALPPASDHPLTARPPALDRATALV